MNFFLLVNSSLEEVAQREIQELLNVSSLVHPQVLEFSAKEEEIPRLVQHLQSARRILVSLGEYKKIEEIDFARSDFPCTDFFPSEFSFKVEVDNVPGQENRFEISRQVAEKWFAFLEKRFTLKIDLKTPQFILMVFFNGEEYFLGLDICGKEVNSRNYRVFPHSASFKGDAGYYFIRTSCFQPGEKLLVGFFKDGVLAIEAALFAQRRSIYNLKKDFSFLRFPMFQKFNFESDKERENIPLIHGFEENLQNLLAARKNVSLAGVKELVSLQKYALDELDVKYAEGEFDRLIFQVTTKDESKINEIYYQAHYLLKPQGTILLIGKGGWEFSVSSKFELKQKGELVRGNSVQGWWLLEKK